MYFHYVTLLFLNHNISFKRKIISVSFNQIVRYLNLEKMLPCYKYTVTVSCLRALRVLQKNGHLPPKSDIFKAYAAYPQYIG